MIEKFLDNNICTKSFQNQNTLMSHVKSVHGRKQYNCKGCSKSFSLIRNLQNHIYSVHEGPKDYKCGSCGKSYSQSLEI